MILELHKDDESYWLCVHEEKHRRIAGINLNNIKGKVSKKKFLQWAKQTLKGLTKEEQIRGRILYPMYEDPQGERMAESDKEEAQG